MPKAIVIGASSGIGKALAHLLASDGYQVGITGRRLDLLEAIRKTSPDRFIVRSFDCTLDNNLSELEALVEELGGLDLLMVSAGTGDLNETLDASIENKTNLLNVAAFTQIVGWAYNHFQSQKKGHLIAISSIAGFRGNKMAPAYGASKAYQINYLEGLRQKAHSEGGHVLITDIRPGFVDTDMAKGPGQFWVASPEKAARQIYRHIRNKRKVAYVTNRWRLFALLMKWMPRGLYKRF
ncbi:MAG: SDR family NAD(P)-dependent oxidoreductase [Roseivirga sp.]|nr:SDR family NAD(P)-dependent oxidoreductase [Roseivirga sp.]